MQSSEPTFFLDSGNLALDLLNTGARSDEHASEQLGSPAALVAWLHAAGLDPARLADPPTARMLLTEAVRLRDEVTELVAGLAVGQPPPSHVVYAINRVLHAGPRSPELRIDGVVGRLEEVARGDTLLAILTPVARAAADLVVSADPSRLRQCAGSSCGRWFVDTSKGGRRRWCSMATCGNRAKAEAHRNRQAIT